MQVAGLYGWEIRSDNKYVQNFSRVIWRKILGCEKIRMWEDKIKVDFRELNCEDYTE